MDRSTHVLEALYQLAMARVAQAIGRMCGDDAYYICYNDHLRDAVHHAEVVAGIDAAEEAPPARRPFEGVAFLESAYDWQYKTEQERLLHESRYPPNPEGHVLYCHRGCNQISTTSGYAVCAACGSSMGPGRDAEDAYYNSLIAAGKCL